MKCKVFPNGELLRTINMEFTSHPVGSIPNNTGLWVTKKFNVNIDVNCIMAFDSLAASPPGNQNPCHNSVLVNINFSNGNFLVFQTPSCYHTSTSAGGNQNWEHILPQVLSYCRFLIWIKSAFCTCLLLHINKTSWLRNERMLQTWGYLTYFSHHFSY